MKRLGYLIGVLLIVGSLISCAKTETELDTGPINPGDQIGNFLITTGEAKDGTYFSWQLECVQQENVEIYACRADLKAKVNVSNGFYAPALSDENELDKIWQEHTYEMWVNDRPVNLQAFGSVDEEHDVVGTIRHWNVVITSSKPGDIKVRSKVVQDGKTTEDTTTYTFKKP